MICGRNQRKMLTTPMKSGTTIFQKVLTHSTNFMKKLSENAGLSRVYTNHCIRSICITNLDECGFEVRHITAVSGHKSESTIKNYSVKKRQMSKILGQNVTPLMPKKPKISHTVPSEPKENKNDTIDLNILDWIPIENNADDFDLGNIITQVDDMERCKQTDLVTKETVNPNLPLSKIQLPNPNVPQNQQFIQNVTNNQSNMQNFPFLPKMVFQNSNVTVNYNFNSK